ncbi:MAG TPA: helix-turn-helix transcriptional regulator [Hymenobacter sp.]|uniref:helix-turn-helix domain-containing protein n=1 Tax=Hymenobacter sp. TaxID=1898978 RepID=UPI002D7FA321|nr:helix-turn-helix transcriptional regulator [Hymenobacter sp.]HET9505652.1 helix-turn-helix transcriptional regulator [Hymenobacter sp.]
MRPVFKPTHRFRPLRKARGYSQQQLADIAHVEQSTSKRLELRQLTPTLDLLISLSRALGLEVRDLVDDPAITHSDLEMPVSKGAEPLLP